MTFVPGGLKVTVFFNRSLVINITCSFKIKANNAVVFWKVNRTFSKTSAFHTCFNKSNKVQYQRNCKITLNKLNVMGLLLSNCTIKSLTDFNWLYCWTCINHYIAVRLINIQWGTQWFSNQSVFTHFTFVLTTWKHLFFYPSYCIFTFFYTFFYSSSTFLFKWISCQ